MAVINIRPQVLDLMLYAGDGIEFRLICTDSGNAPVDITGTVRAQIRLDRLTYSRIHSRYSRCLSRYNCAFNDW